ncbi:MAG: quinol dehydrogenase ferredoxin subunit NapH [Parasutterella sp.]
MIGAGIILAVYWVVSGRSFCSWVCPMNLVTDFAFWCRKKLGINTNVLSLSSGTRYVLLALALILSIVTGTAAFEAISPQGILWREIVYGGFLGLLSAVFGIFALDLAVTKRGWCGHLCPLGAFWALWGKIGLTKVKFDNDTCTRCGDCIKVCPEPQVINFKKAAEIGMYASGECTNCGKCVSICPENSLKFGIRLIKDSKKTQ